MSAPKEIVEGNLLIVTFTIKDTREKLKLLKQFMIENNIHYE